MSSIRVAVEDGVARITLNRPEQRNALNRETADAITAALNGLGALDDVRVITLAGEGADFCAGADLAALQGMVDAPIDEHERDALSLGKAFLTLHRVRVPTVAIVHGNALAGGAGLAIACDLVIARDDAVLGFPEVRLGFVPAMVMALLVRSVGEKVAFDLVATARRLSAEEARACGLVSRVLPAADFADGSREIVSQLAKLPPGALATTKALLYRLRGLDLEAGILEGARTNAQARTTEEFREGLQRFFERRKSP